MHSRREIFSSDKLGIQGGKRHSMRENVFKEGRGIQGGKCLIWTNETFREGIFWFRKIFGQENNFVKF